MKATSRSDDGASRRELHQDDKNTRISLNQVAQSRDLLLAAAHDLQVQIDNDRALDQQRIDELVGKAAARSI